METEKIMNNIKTNNDISFSDFESKRNGRTLQFSVTGIKTSMLNGIRRSIINDIPNIGFGYEPKNSIIIKENTTALHDEYLSHRISLIPVMIPNWIDSPAKFDISEYIFNLSVEQKKQDEYHGYVTTDNIEVFRQIGTDKIPVENGKDFFPRDYIYDKPILITRFPSRDSVDQKLNIDFKLIKGTNAENASFSPVSVCVCYEDENDSNKHTFMVESVGIFSPYILVYKGIENLILKCVKIREMIDKIGSKYNGKYKAVEYVVDGESHTFGNMLQEFIYDNEFSNDLLKGNNITHISYHEPHPLENNIIFRIVLNEEENIIDDFEIYKLQCNDLMKKYITDLENMLYECLDNWKENYINDKRSSLLTK